LKFYDSLIPKTDGLGTIFEDSVASISSTVCFHFTIHHNRHVPTAVKKLHYFVSVMRHRRPFGFGVWLWFVRKVLFSYSAGVVTRHDQFYRFSFAG
jgi:hypothetical protein